MLGAKLGGLDVRCEAGWSLDVRCEAGWFGC